jgi:hypothetical protein
MDDQDQAANGCTLQVAYTIMNFVQQSVREVAERACQ